MTEGVSGQSVWLFTREQEAVRLLVQPAAAGFRLLIAGPGPASAEFDFTEMSNLDLFRQNYERDLLARGFRIEAAVERRSGVDRRSVPRPSPERRR